MDPPGGRFLLGRPRRAGPGFPFAELCFSETLIPGTDLLVEDFVETGIPTFPAG